MVVVSSRRTDSSPNSITHILAVRMVDPGMRRLGPLYGLPPPTDELHSEAKSTDEVASISVLQWENCFCGAPLSCASARCRLSPTHRQTPPKACHSTLRSILRNYVLFLACVQQQRCASCQYPGQRRARSVGKGRHEPEHENVSLTSFLSRSA